MLAPLLHAGICFFPFWLKLAEVFCMLSQPLSLSWATSLVIHHLGLLQSFYPALYNDLRAFEGKLT